jgi:hypothetical protein
MAQLTPEPAYDHDLARRAIEFLHTEDRRLFPFTQTMDNALLAAFKRDLREGLRDTLNSGSARKTSATGFVTSGRRLGKIIHEWRSAGGGWPEGADPDVLETALAALDERDPDDDVELSAAVVEDHLAGWRRWE